MKQKDVAFPGPTLDLDVDDVLLTKWLHQSFTVSQWREKFQHVRSAAKSGSSLNKEEIKLEEERAIIALDFKTPSKRRI